MANMSKYALGSIAILKS